MTVEFGRARPDELTTIEKLLADNEWGVRRYDSGEWILARDDGAIVGVVHVTDVDEGTRYVDDLVVVSERRGAGIGDQLMRHLLGDRDATTYLVCHDERVSFYQRLGFDMIDELEAPGTVRTHAYKTDDLPSTTEHVHHLMRRSGPGGSG